MHPVHVSADESEKSLEQSNANAAPGFTAEQINFFEHKIRPILQEKCLSCHGDKKQEGGLRLDSRSTILKGGDRGAAVIPGNAEGSLLFSAVRYQDKSLQMPPQGPLPENVIADLQRWIDWGVPWPDSSSAPAPKSANPLDHWSLKSVVAVTPPPLADAAAAKSPIDAFIISALQAHELGLSEIADRRTLIRRLSFDLLGLPPSAEEIDAFIADQDPQAWEKLIDRYLASPRYGERWGRHWLDVARYADNRGYKFFGSDELFAFTYRDWVIQAFNEDLPYDQFILQQLAADRLITNADTRPLAALGFLTVGRRFLEDKPDIIDDRIDVITRGFLGQSVTCARCHDHKFDPIPTADYYSLFGVLAGSAEVMRTLSSPDTITPEETAFANELNLREQTLQDYLKRRHRELLADFRGKIAEYLMQGQKSRASPPMDRFMFVEVPGTLSQLVVGNWRAMLDRTAQKHDPIFAPWHAFAGLPPDQFAAQASTLANKFAAHGDPEHPINPLVARLFDTPPADLVDVAKRYESLLKGIDAQWSSLVAAAGSNPPPRQFEDPHLESLRRVLYGPLAPMDVPVTDVEFLVGREGQKEINDLRGKISEHLASATVKPKRTLALEEQEELNHFQPRIFVRGKPTNLGDEVPRQMLKAVAGENRAAFQQGSGRLELAKAIGDKKNPLTARVIVNRVWQWHFGTGLVRTPSDFGVRGDPPTHPELLDFLANYLMDHDWSLKQLHRLILNCRTYQQASTLNNIGLQKDPDNRLLWHFPRQRLDLETMRDSLLFVSGELDTTMGGLPVPIAEPPYSTRRSVYGFIDRQNLPGLFRTFDFANADSHTPIRFTTTIPQQALYFMNHPFVEARANALASLAEFQNETDLEKRITLLYRRVFGRMPDDVEKHAGMEFINSPQEAPPISEWHYGYGELDESNKLLNFQPLPYFTGQRWQGGSQLPDGALGWLYLDALGGHPGLGRKFCIIRRWTAPRGGELSIEGELKHEVAAGDGVVGHIISSRQGPLASWSVHNRQATTALKTLTVEPHDTLDFVVECGPNMDINNDQHLWSPKIVLKYSEGAETKEQTWQADHDFRGPYQTPWQRYVHAILQTNEFVFTD